LARGLEHLPEVSRRHGSKILFVILALLVVTFLLRQRITATREASERAAYALNEVRGAIRDLDSAAERVGRPEQLAGILQQVSTSGEEAIRQVLESTDNPALLAEAQLARGDLNWQLATFPDIPGATTRPELQLTRTDEQLLQAAADSYQAVVDNGSAPRGTVVTARLSLAAVAENRGQWDKAREHYQKVIDDTQAPKPLKDLAVQRLQALEEIKNPPLIGRPATDEAEPGTRPATSTTPVTTPPSPAPAGSPAGEKVEKEDPKPATEQKPNPTAPPSAAPSQPTPAQPSTGS
jgi:tetratricopeptide (TPR) repeat protein